MAIVAHCAGICKRLCINGGQAFRQGVACAPVNNPSVCCADSLREEADDAADVPLLEGWLYCPFWSQTISATTCKKQMMSRYGLGQHRMYPNSSRVENANNCHSRPAQHRQNLSQRPGRGMRGPRGPQANFFNKGTTPSGFCYSLCTGDGFGD